jgi:Zn-dependent peptidase ImmA (M78 family)
MAVSRMNLADATSPDRLAMEIFKNEPDLAIPVPIEKLCRQLDISDIQPLQTAGYEGGLITDRDKSAGVVLVNANSREQRQRFTIAHELAHFLMPSHLPSAEGHFLCSQEDMFQLHSGEQDQRRRMEAEANRFASLILLPPKHFRSDVAATKDPSLQHVTSLSERYNVSKEAVARAYTDFRDEPTAVLIAKDGRLLRSYVPKSKFPFLSVTNGTPLPRQSLLVRKQHNIGAASDLEGTDTGVWFDVERGKRAPTLYEQVLAQQQGYAMIMLTLEPLDDEDRDPDDDRTSKERLRDRQSQWRSR